jgi:hypothetical protein
VLRVDFAYGLSNSPIPIFMLARRVWKKEERKKSK